LWIKPFQANGEFYVYSAWSNVIHRISERLYRYFADDADPSCHDEQSRVAAALGLLPDRPVPLEVFPEAMIRHGLARLQREGPVRLVITVTEACNFRCRYCVFSGAYPCARQHANRGISAKTARKALRWYFGFSRQRYGIQFYGGEPLLRRRMIGRLVKEARKMVPTGARLRFGMTTNGWLLDDAAIAFLAENAFDLAVSLDGPASVHDRYRRTLSGRPTFRRVWDRVRRIRALYPEYFAEQVTFLMTLAPPSRVAEIIEFCRQNLDVFAGKVPGIATLNDAPPALYEALEIGSGQERVDLAELREHYLAHLARGETPDGLSRAASEAAMRMLARRSMISPSILTISAGQCVPGIRCHVTPDGALHMCERANTSLPIGHVDAGFDERKIEGLLNRFSGLICAQCRDCWAIRLCRRCIADFAEGARLSPDRLAAICIGRRQALERDLIDYCRARSRDNHCFDGLAADEDNPDDLAK
jgi:uncharacterized protein